MKNILLITPLIATLTACGAPTAEDLVEDPVKLGEIISECTTLMAQGKDTNTEECTNAKKAQKIMAKNMMKGFNKQMKDMLK